VALGDHSGEKRAEASRGAGNLRIVLDASIVVDAYAGRSKERREAVLSLLEMLDAVGAELVEPRLFVVEIAGVLVRYIKPEDVVRVLALLEGVARLVPETEYWGLAKDIALKTGSRAADSYYIAVARLTDALLVTSDRPQAVSARRAGVEAYYLPAERDELFRLLRRYR